MARRLIASSSQYLTRAAAVVSAAPLTMACWYRPVAIAGGASKSLITIDDGSGATQYFLLRSVGGTGVTACYCPLTTGSVAGAAVDGVWSHHAAVFASTTSRTAYLNGVAGSVDTSVGTPTGLTTTNVGRLWGAAQFADGDIAEVAIWNVALTAAELQALAAGLAPILIRPGALVAYWPLLGGASPEPDLFHGADLTVSGGAAAAPHPRIVRPEGVAQIARPATVIAPAPAPANSILYLSINGIARATGRIEAEGGVLVGSLAIQDNDGANPNTCTFTTYLFAPQSGDRVIAAFERIDHPRRLFAGTILTVEQTNLETGGHEPEYHVSCIDDTWRLNGRLVTARYQNASASAIALDLMTRYTLSVPAGYARGFTVTGIQEGLPVIDEITLTDAEVTDALTQLVRRFGGYWDVTYFNDLVLGFSHPVRDEGPVPLSVTNLRFSALGHARDITQWITRVIVEGGGATAAAAIVLGETSLPVIDTAWYPPPGGLVQVGPQRIAYTEALPGGGGSVVGPGASPGAAPTLALATGNGLGVGVYKYALVDTVPGGGKSLPSALATITTLADRNVAAPTMAPGAVAGNNGAGYGLYPGWQIGDQVNFCYTWSTSPDGSYFGTKAFETAPSPEFGVILQRHPVWPTDTININITIYTSSDPGVKWVHFWQRNVTRGEAWTETIVGHVASNGVAAAYPCGSLYQGGFGTQTGLPTPNGIVQGAMQVNVTGIALGAAPTSGRELYRTAVNGAQLKLLTTIANNTSTGPFLDTVADGSLGANAPTSDTSGLTQPSGQVLPGATAIPAASAADFPASGGWAITGNGSQAVKYTGISGNSLTGVPASGPGSITATIPYNSQITAAPSLRGIPASGPGALQYPIARGDQVNIAVVVDDLVAQAARSVALDPTNLLGGAAGIREAKLTDGRIGYTEAAARGRAWLRMRGTPLLTVHCETRDPLTVTGRDLEIVLPGLGITASLKIIQVSISDFSETGDVFPRYAITASSERLTFEDWLRVERR